MAGPLEGTAPFSPPIYGLLLPDIAVLSVTVLVPGLYTLATSSPVRWLGALNATRAELRIPTRRLGPVVLAEGLCARWCQHRGDFYKGLSTYMRLLRTSGCLQRSVSARSERGRRRVDLHVRTPSSPVA